MVSSYYGSSRISLHFTEPFLGPHMALATHLILMKQKYAIWRVLLLGDLGFGAMVAVEEFSNTHFKVRQLTIYIQEFCSVWTGYPAAQGSHKWSGFALSTSQVCIQVLWGSICDPSSSVFILPLPAALRSITWLILLLLHMLCSGAYLIPCHIVCSVKTENSLMDVHRLQTKPLSWLNLLGKHPHCGHSPVAIILILQLLQPKLIMHQLHFGVLSWHHQADCVSVGLGVRSVSAFPSSASQWSPSASFSVLSAPALKKIGWLAKIAP